MRFSQQGKGLIIFIAVLILFTLPHRVRSQYSDLQFLNPSKKSVTIPFRLINNLIIIPLFINDSDTLFFIFDTGISSAIMTELAADEILSLNYTRQIKLQGLGKGDPIDALHSTGNNFLMEGIVGFNQDLYILTQNIFNLSTLLGTRIHGLIGYNLVRNFITEINYEKKEITFHDTASYTFPRTRRTQILPLTLENSKPYILGTLGLESGVTLPVKLMVDLGASHALWVDQHSDPRITLPARTLPSFLGTGLSGEIYGAIGRVSSITLGRYTFRDVITAFPDSSSAGVIHGLDNRNGSIGTEIFRRFRVILDYHNRKIGLMPNKHYSDYFKINMSGLEIEAVIPGLPVYQISYVRRNSPAARAGLRRGDQIISINNKDAFSLNINRIYEIFEGSPGKKIRMVVKRSGQRFKTVFYLEDWI